MEDKPSTSNTDVTKEENASDNTSTKDEKSKKERKTGIMTKISSLFVKKSSSPKDKKKMWKSSKSLPLCNVNSVSSSKDARSQSFKNFNYTPKNDTESKQGNDTELTSDKDNEMALYMDIKTSSDNENETTLDKDNQMTSDKDHITIPDENNEPSIDKETIELTSNDADITLKGEMDAKLTVSDDTESAINNDIESTTDDIRTEAIIENCSSNDQDSSSLKVCSETRHSIAEISKCDANDSSYEECDNSHNISHDNSYNNTEDVRITEDTSTAVIEDHTDDKTDLNSEDDEYDENRVAVLRELMETEKEYIQILSQKVDDFIKVLRDSEVIGYNGSIPKCLSSLEIDTSTLKKNNNMISNNKDEPSLFIVD